MGIAGEHLTGGQMAEAFTRALGQEVVYNEVSPELFRSFGFPGADDLGNMFQFKRDFNEDFRAARSGIFPRAELTLQSFGQWLEANRDRIPCLIPRGRRVK